MTRHLLTGLSLSAISALVATTAFADGGQGIGRAGTYQTQTTSATTTQTPKTRAEVRAELAAAYSNGTLPALNRNTYPDKSMAGEAIAAQHAKRAQEAAVAEERNREIVQFANGSVVPVGNNVR